MSGLENHTVGIGYLYFRKAFDTATHQVVTEKLVKHGLEQHLNEVGWEMAEQMLWACGDQWHEV